MYPFQVKVHGEIINNDTAFMNLLIDFTEFPFPFLSVLIICKSTFLV